MAYAERADLILEYDERRVVELLDDERILDDLKPSKATYFQVDTAGTSGHFEDSTLTAITVGPGNTARHIREGCKFRTEDGWLEVVTITNNGDGDNEVTVSAVYGCDCVPGTGVYEIELLEPEAGEDRLDRLIERACAEVDTILEKNGVSTPVSMDGSALADLVRSATVAFIFRALVMRRGSFNPEREGHLVTGATKMEARLKEVLPTGYEIARVSNVDTYLEDNDDVEFYQQALSRNRLRGF